MLSRCVPVQLLQMSDVQLADLYFDLYDVDRTGQVSKASIISMLFATPQHYSRMCRRHHPVSSCYRRVAARGREGGASITSW